MKNYKLILLLLLIAGRVSAQQKKTTVFSPDRKLAVSVWTSADKAFYEIEYDQQTVLKPSALGLKLNPDALSKLKFSSASSTQLIRQNYKMVYAKKSSISYMANRKTFQYLDEQRRKIAIVFQVSNDAVSFRYEVYSKQETQVTGEMTTMSFPEGTKTWLQPMQVSKTGWEATNPAYEEHYAADVDIVNVKENSAGWVYPALLRVDKNWVLITESALDPAYCATRLLSTNQPGVFQIGFPDPREIITGKGLLPLASPHIVSPWRVMAIGSLKAIVESTAGTDLAVPNQLKNTDFVNPGKSSWSWINSKDDFITYDEQKKYIDFASDMKWQYCLIDVNWDTKIGYARMKELADYAKTKNVGLLLWYNSAGDWNTVKYTPKNLLLSHESRMKEFSKIHAMGIKGIKVDFFAGDGQSVIQYYMDILKDAAANQLMVNFHGATLPRGWARTYPNLLTAEAVRGFENVTFQQAEADRQAEICTVLPFTRNVFDPMDYTPMNLYKVPSGVIRKTSNAFELALSVMFLSGIQHYAESPEGMTKVDPRIKKELSGLPDHWDEIRFLDGYPGKYVVIARRSAQTWYISGINAQAAAQEISLDLSAFKQGKMTLISEGNSADSFSVDQSQVGIKDKRNITIKPSGGFLAVIR